MVESAEVCQWQSTGFLYSFLFFIWL
jgi:hypothetical protein